MLFMACSLSIINCRASFTQGGVLYHQQLIRERERDIKITEDRDGRWDGLAPCSGISNGLSLWARQDVH